MLGNFCAPQARDFFFEPTFDVLWLAPTAFGVKGLSESEDPGGGPSGNYNIL